MMAAAEWCVRAFVGSLGGNMSAVSAAGSGSEIGAGSTLVLGLDLVDRWFFRDWSMWPLIMAMDWGGYLVSAADVRPGKSGR